MFRLQSYVFLLETTYDVKWNGLCFNDKTKGDVYSLSQEECKEKCTSDSSCNAFASHPDAVSEEGKYRSNHCRLYQTSPVSRWTKTTHKNWICYEKNSGISYESFLIMVYK